MRAANLIVLSFLAPYSLSRLQKALPPPSQVSAAESWNDVLSRIRDRRCDVAVVDPCAGSEQSATARLDALASVNASAVGIVGYVSVTAASMRAACRLARFPGSEIIIRGVDDSAMGLSSAVHRATAACAANRLLSSAERRFDALPARAAAALTLMFRHPEQARSVADLAQSARMTRRSLDRWLARAGLASARTLLACARANAAYHLMAGCGLDPSQTASRLGCTSTRSLSRELQSLTGTSASSMLSRLSRDRFVALLERRLVRETSVPGVMAPMG